MSTHYDELGVPPNASEEEIRKAYRRKVQRVHPDKKPGGNKEAFMAVQLAYEVLNDPRRRSHYDRTGEDKPPNAVQHARDYLIAMLLSLIDKHDEEHTNFIELMRENIRKEEIEVRAGLAKLSFMISKYERALKRLRRKSESSEPDVLQRALQGRIVERKRQIEQGKEQAESFIHLYELIDQYAYDADLILSLDVNELMLALRKEK